MYNRPALLRCWDLAAPADRAGAKDARAIRVNVDRAAHGVSDDDLEENSNSGEKVPSILTKKVIPEYLNALFY